MTDKPDKMSFPAKVIYTIDKVLEDESPLAFFRLWIMAAILIGLVLLFVSFWAILASFLYGVHPFVMWAFFAGSATVVTRYTFKGYWPTP